MAGTTGDKNPNPRHDGRWEFTGHKAEDAVRNLYVGRSVRHYFKQGLQSPVVYARCGGMSVKL